MQWWQQMKEFTLDVDVRIKGSNFEEVQGCLNLTDRHHDGDFLGAPWAKGVQDSHSIVGVQELCSIEGVAGL